MWDETVYIKECNQNERVRQIFARSKLEVIKVPQLIKLI